MGLPTLELRPGLGLGPFNLGMPLCDALTQVENYQALFSNVHVKYSEIDSLTTDILISIPHLGFHLRFEPLSQRLRLVEVYDITRVQLRYASSVIGGPSIAATFVRVYAVLGPTFPGVYDNKRGLYSLSYPGLSLLFPIPSQYSAHLHEELPLEFPDGSTPITSRVCVHVASSTNFSPFSAPTSPTSHLATMGDLLPALPAGSLYMEAVHVTLGHSLRFSVGGQQLCFGCSPQDVWADMGRPCCIAPKQVDAMLIHSSAATMDSAASAAVGTAAAAAAAAAGAGAAGGIGGGAGGGGSRGGGGAGDYLYSYFTRGFDILFDGQSHRAVKFVLHTNAPGHPDFTAYVKCNFVIHTEEGARHGSATDDSGSQSGGEEGRQSENITANTSWEGVEKILGCGGQAAIQARGSTNNPFGPTYVYGYRNIAFEVMKNGQIAAVTLFQAK